MKDVNVYTWTRGVVLLLSLLVVTNCATKIPIQQVIPPDTNLAGIRTIAILKFRGDQNDEVRNSLYNQLSDSGHFSLVDTTLTDTIDAELMKKIDDDPRAAMEIQSLQADAIIVGRISSNVTEKNGVDESKTDDGTERKPYVLRKASMNANFKVCNLMTRKVLATGKITRKREEKYGGNMTVGQAVKAGTALADIFSGASLEKLKKIGKTAPKSIDDMPHKADIITKLSDQVAADFTRKISPTHKTIYVSLADDEEVPELKTGNSLIKAGALPDAKEEYERILMTHPTNPAATYNLGVCHEASGNLDEALKCYQGAKSVNDASMAIARVRKTIANNKKVARLKEELPEESRSGGMNIQ